MQGVTTQYSKPKINNACTTAFKNMDTCGSSPSLISILVFLFHTSLARDKLLTTAGQLLYTADITCPRYRKEFTISRRRP